MASGQALRAKVDAALRKAGATSRLVQFRKVTRTGGNTRLGVGGTQSVETIAVDPQPTVTQLAANVISSSGGLYQFGDYELTLSGSTDETFLKTYQILYGDEVLQIVQYRPTGVVGGVVVAWTVIARTAK